MKIPKCTTGEVVSLRIITNVYLVECWITMKLCPTVLSLNYSHECLIYTFISIYETDTIVVEDLFVKYRCEFPARIESRSGRRFVRRSNCAV